jgi:aspartate aminotransferase
MRDFRAQRMRGVEASGTVKTADTIARLKAQGKEVVSFSVGEPDFPTPPHICQAAAQAMDQGYTHYTSSFGLPALREEIARKSRDENHIACETKHVLVTPAKQAIFEVLMASIDPGDEVVLTDPAWVSYEPIVRMAGGRPVTVTVEAHKDFRMLPEDVASVLTPKTKLVIANSPNNPTGSVLRDSDVKGIADLARDHDLWVLSDEIYEKILYEGKHTSFASLDGMFERTITVNGFSKAYAMTGWRLGWLLAPEPALAEISKIQQHSITHCTAFAMVGGIAALKGSQRSVQDMVREFQARRDLVVEGLNKIPGFNCVRPKGAFYAFPSYAFNMNSQEFGDFLLQEAGVAVTAGSSFGRRGEGHVRISYANSRENLQKGLERIAAACKKLG